MLQFLLDEHLSPEIATQLISKRVGLHAVSIQEWEGGNHLGERDETLLASACDRGLTLVTYDLRTIPPLLKVWGEAGTPHGGVIFVDERTLAPNDFRGLVNALIELWDAQKGLVWRNRVVFLTRQTGYTRD